MLLYYHFQHSEDARGPTVMNGGCWITSKEIPSSAGIYNYHGWIESGVKNIGSLQWLYAICLGS